MNQKTRKIQAEILRMYRRFLREDSEAYTEALGRLAPGQDRLATHEWNDFKKSIHGLAFERRFSKTLFGRKVNA